MGERWMQWAVAEGMAKSVGRLLHKFIGVASGSLAGALWSTFLVGAIQTASGILVAPLLRGRSLWAGWGRITGGILFGIIASVMTVLAVVSFTYPGADVGITTFIVATSIIPGAFIDWAFFRHPLKGRQWLGVGVFLVAGYAMLNFPPLDALALLPPWVWLSAGIALLAACNEGITQWQGRGGAERLDPLVNNFWVGLTTLVCTGLGLLILGSWGAGRAFGWGFWIGSALAGIVIVSMLSFKLLSYQGGGSIALKKLIMQGTYLTAATILGMLVYREPFTPGKIIGIVGFFIAFTFMDEGTWQFMTHRLRPAGGRGR